MDWGEEVLRRLLPAAAGPGLTWRELAAVAGVALLLVSVGPLWRVVRLGVTLVHELGHAFTGILCGRRFTGFVLRADMSGHAVTSGPTRGLGLTLTTWAGYPAPALLALGVLAAVGHGWAAPLLVAGALAVLVATPRVRSFLTGLVVLVVLAALGALWWWRDDRWQAAVLVGGALVLLVGAWRHILAVAAGGDRGSDPAVLARLTRVPRVLWLLSFTAVAAACTYGGAVVLGLL